MQGARPLVKDVNTLSSATTRHESTREMICFACSQDMMQSHLATGLWKGYREHAHWTAHRRGASRGLAMECSSRPCMRSKAPSAQHPGSNMLGAVVVCAVPASRLADSGFGHSRSAKSHRRGRVSPSGARRTGLLGKPTAL